MTNFLVFNNSSSFCGKCNSFLRSMSYFRFERVFGILALREDEKCLGFLIKCNKISVLIVY